MTYNEEANIARCLESVKALADEILIVDSFSNDRTVEIAKQFGARIEMHPFVTFADQRRAMYAMATHDWILTLDADEYLSPELMSSVKKTMAGPVFDAYSSNRKSKIAGTWLNHGSWYPDRKIRLFNRNKARVNGIDVHESVDPLPGAMISHLCGDLMHLAGESIDTRYQKINLYSTKAAEGMYKQGLHTNWFRISFKPMIRFISVYLVRLGILDGFYGYVIAKSEAHYVWLRETKLKALSKG